MSTTLWWELRFPEQGLAIGSPNFMRPDFNDINPIDWLATASMSDPSSAVNTDGFAPEDAVVSVPRGHIELFMSYASSAVQPFLTTVSLGLTFLRRC